jgi:hypothetical protein
LDAVLGTGVQLVGWIVGWAAGRQIRQKTVVAEAPVTVAANCRVPFVTTVAVEPVMMPGAVTVTPTAVEFPPHAATIPARSNATPSLQTLILLPPAISLVLPPRRVRPGSLHPLLHFVFVKMSCSL